MTRLHPAGIAVLALSALRGAAIPVLVAAVAAGGTSAVLRALGFALLAVVIAAATGYLTWRTKTYAVTERAIEARQGILSVRETVVPLERVQALDTVQGPVQRLFGVTAVHVQAAGGGEAGEIVLEALSPAAVAALRDAVGRRGEGTDATAAPAPDAVRSLSRRRLAVAALTSGQLGIILPVLAGATQLLDDVLGRDAERALERVGGLPDSPLALLGVLAVLLAAAWILSILGAVVAFANFTAVREGDRLLIDRGLFARREASVPLPRVQAVTVVEGLLRQPLGLAAVRVDVAGYAAEASAAQTLFPLVRRTEVEALLADLAPELAGADAPLERPPARARRRYALPPALLGALVGAAATRIPGLGAWPVLLAAIGLLAGLAAHRAAGWRLEPHRIAVRSRRLARRTVLVPRRRLQEHEVEQSGLQRRGGLASISIAAGAGTRAGVAHLDAAEARDLFAALAVR